MDFDPAQVNLKVAQGTHRRVRMRLVTPTVPADRINGVWTSRATGLPLTDAELNPYDFAGKTIRGAMRKKHTAGASPLTSTSGINFSADATPPTAGVGPEPGMFWILFTPETTSPLKATDYVLEASESGAEILTASDWVYDGEVVDTATGEVGRLVYGQVVITAEVTK